MFRFALAALACPLLLAQDDLRQRVNDALTAARPALLDHLQAATQPETRPGELALLVLAALHDGVDSKDPILSKAVQRLAKADPDETYDVALRLMVLEAHPDFPDRDKLAARDAKELLSHRGKKGCFSYTQNAGNWDLSNTQYGALGLRSATALGIKIERSVWTELAHELCEQQDSYGGFNYTNRARNADAYASMTAAGIAVLAICRQQLGDRHSLASSLDQHIGRGWQWFARNEDVVGSPRERWSFYFHYGLERAAILTDIDKVGKFDWYTKGAQMLVDLQLPGGGWRSDTDGYPGTHLGQGRGNSVSTAFAILFLRRKFQKNVAAITPHIVTLAAVGRYSKDADVDACADELTRRGKAAMPDVLFALRSDIEPQRRAAAKALLAIAGETFGYDAKADAETNQQAVRSAELWYLRNR